MSSLITNTFVDGQRNTVMKHDIVCDDSDLTLQLLIDTTTLSEEPMGYAYSRVRLDHIEYDVEDGLAIYLYWEGQLNNAVLWRLAGRGRVPADQFGGLQNTAVDPTGNILVKTQGWSLTAGELSASFITEWSKQ